MLHLLALTAIAAAPPPPGIVVTPALLTRVADQSASTPGPIPVRVRVAAGSDVLFNDTFQVTRNAGGSYQESRSEAAPGVCSAEPYYSAQERYSLTINAYLRDNSTGPAINVSVRWQRPSKLLTCGGEGSREVTLTQTVPLAPGQSVTLQGDAGLTVTLSR